MRITKRQLRRIIKEEISRLTERSEQGYRGPHKDIYDLGYGAGVKKDTVQDDEAFDKYQYDSPEGNAWKAGFDDGMADGGWR
jgi:hypothetical protein